MTSPRVVRAKRRTGFTDVDLIYELKDQLSIVPLRECAIGDLDILMRLANVPEERLSSSDVERLSYLLKKTRNVQIKNDDKRRFE